MSSTEKPGWLKEVEDVLECPVCLKTILDPPIHVCENGHCLCEKCRGQLVKNGKPCPTCKGVLTQKRNLALEKMVDRLPKQACQFPGCKFAKACANLVEEHEDDCYHRTVLCNLRYCQDMVPVSRMGKHLRDEHYKLPWGVTPFNTWNPLWYNPKEFPAGTRACNLIPITYEYEGISKTTSFVCYIFRIKNHCLIWVSHTQPKNPERRYRYELNLLCGKEYDNGKTVVLVQHSDFCIPHDVAPEAIREDMRGLALTQNYATNVASPKEGKTRMQLRITKEY